MKSSEYWKERFEAIENESYRKSQAYYKDLQEQFRIAQNNITLDIEHWYQRLADNNEISLAAAKRLLKKNELEEFHWNVQQYIKKGEENAVNQQWMKQLENASAKYHISYLEAMKLQIQQHCELLSAQYNSSLTDFLHKSYESQFYHSAYEIQKGIGVGWNLAKIDTNKIDKIITTPWAMDGKNFSERVWTNKEKLVRELHTQLAQSIIRGEDPQKAINHLAKAMNVSKSVAGRLIMTESAAISSMSQKDCFDELDVEQYEIVATLDSHTSDICQGMDGQHFKMSEWEVGITAPPFHVNCRTATVPYFHDEFDRVGERAARGEDGKTYYVPADMTYKQWQNSFMDGDKAGLQEAQSTVDKKTDVNYNKTRTIDELQSVTQDIKTSISDYADTESKWSGKINIDNSLSLDNALGRKEWNCDITLVDTVDDGIIWHEMLHSASVSHYDETTYIMCSNIEEASVEFLKQQICKEKDIVSIPAYDELTVVLKTLNDKFQYGTDMEFAKQLYNIPLTERYRWLEDLVDNSLRQEGASFEDYNDVMKFMETLKGGLR